MTKISEERKRQNELKNKCIDFLIDVMGYKPKMKLPTLTFKKIEEYREPYGFDVLLDTLRKEEQTIRWSLANKDLKSETAKILYIFGIIQNSAGGVWRNKVKKQREMRINEEEIDLGDLEINNGKQKVRDISAYVEEDD